MLACLQEQKRPMKAYELLESLRHEGINAPMTIYRALGRLANYGRVKKIESINAFYAVPDGDTGETVAFLICEQCDTIGFKLIDSSTVAGLVDGVDIKSASIELKTGCFGDDVAVLSGACPQRNAKAS
ncbi:MAG: transcriptional repressor [Pseudomonadota bacterium]